MGNGVHALLAGLNLPPVFKDVENGGHSCVQFSPPHTIISEPVHTAVADERLVGALASGIGAQVPFAGL